MCKLSRHTLDLGLKREQQMGDYRAITGLQLGKRHQLTAWERFGEFAQQGNAIDLLFLAEHLLEWSRSP